MSDPELGDEFDIAADEADIETVGAEEVAGLVDGESAPRDDDEHTEDTTRAATSSGTASTETVRTANVDDDRSRRSFGWLYLLMLFGVAAAVFLAAIARDDEVIDVAEPLPTPDVTVSELTAVDLEFVVDGDSVTLRGAVPNEDVRETLVSSAQGRFANVVDELSIDADRTTEGGRLTVSGSAFEGDEDPAGLQADAAASLGLEAGAFDVELLALDKTPVDAQMRVSTDNVVLTGAFPDQASLDEFQGASDRNFGAEFTDATALTVDPETTLTNSTITITGTIDGADFRAQRMEAELDEFFGGSTIDSSGIVFDTTPPALTRIEDRLRAQVAASPIQFDSGSAEILPESDAILQSLATALIATPGVPVEIVGHTDNTGDAGTNQLLSEDRAEAVVNRLVSLGVDGARLTFTGVGPADPIADNDTDEGKAANRRIEFELEGAEEPVEEETTDEDADAADGDEVTDEETSE